MTRNRFSDIESWLREQWAGLFRELLNRQSQQQQFAALTAQVSGLKEVNETLKKYLEALMTGVTPDKTSELIESEERRLEDMERQSALKDNRFIRFIIDNFEVSFDDVMLILKKATSPENLSDLVATKSLREDASYFIINLLKDVPGAQNDLNNARLIIGADPFPFESQGSR